MNDPLQAVEAAIQEIDRLQKNLAKGKSPQIWSADERLMLKATALTWFKTHKSKISGACDAGLLVKVDTAFDRLHGYSERSILRLKLKRECKEAKHLLVDVRAAVMKAGSVATAKVDNNAPDFSPLISDSKMQEILKRRWEECIVCIKSGAPLSATVMMGGLVEGLLLARVNTEPNKAPIFTAKTAPRDTAGKSLALKEWMLKNFLDVCHELGWISNSAKDVGTVLREYRNYIHPQKELTHDVNLEPNDAKMFWDVCKNISREIIESV
jgi:hypothetical protein